MEIASDLLGHDGGDAELGIQQEATPGSTKSTFRYNLETFTSDPASEISGAFGDIGTLLPILIALTNNNSISVTSTLVFTGLWNIISGAFWGVPIVVQPMKAIASVAIAQKFSLEQNMAAGMVTAIMITLLSALGLIRRLGILVPVPVIKGIQLGVGLSFFNSARKMAADLPWSPLQDLGNNWVIAAAVFAFFLLGKSRAIPHAGIIFLLGLGIGIIRTKEISFAHHIIPPLVVPSPNDFKVGLVQGAIGQVPLTILNSILAVVAVSEDLLPDRDPPTVTHLGFSIGLMNTVGCLFGAMPVCHGSGGLLSQHKFGARSGASVIFFGLLKIILALLLGDSLIAIFDNFPSSILAAMLFVAGLGMLDLIRNLNDTARDIKHNEGPLTDAEKQRRWQLMIVSYFIYSSLH